MSHGLRTSERLAMEVATRDLRDAALAYDDARAKLNAAVSNSDPLRPADRFVSNRYVRASAQLSKAKDRWVAEYVALRGVTAAWAERRCANEMKIWDEQAVESV